MSLRNFVLALMVPLICAAPSGRLMAKTAEDPCEKAIAQKVKEEKKPKKVVFESDARRAIPHGPLTHYAGKGSYVMPGGERSHFDWFCDLNDASGKPTNLYYTVLKTEAPVQRATPPPKPKDEIVANETLVRQCQNAIESELKKKNSPMLQLDFHSANVSPVSDTETFLEGDGSFKIDGKSDRAEEVQFSYRCIYNEKSEKITAKSVQMK